MSNSTVNTLDTIFFLLLLRIFLLSFAMRWAAITKYAKQKSAQKFFYIYESSLYLYFIFYANDKRDVGDHEK